ncbi:HEAT repeat domain-containing protein [Rosistilla carotiformis]|nr:hypothetical protein [Rosistilla carotiformis]
MSNVGGSANINGILYQVLGTLDRAVNPSITYAKCTGDDITQAQLIIEPAGGGGDLEIVDESCRVVQQWKAKARGGTWALKKIIEDVLTDLYMAVRVDDLESNTKYQFVTEGKIGDWRDTMEFFKSLPLHPSEGIAASLTDITKRHKIGKYTYNDDELFNYIVAKVSKREPATSEPEGVVKSKLFHLLARFEIVESQNHELLAVRINAFLGHHVDYSEDVDAKRRQLCGLLLEIASQGMQSVSAESLLRRCSIPVHSFLNWHRLLARMKQRLVEQLSKEQYDKTYDPRDKLNLERTITAIRGESGQGKTWRLAGLATDVAASNCLVIWVPSAREPADVSAYVAKEIWNYGLERDAVLTLESVASRRAQSTPDIETPWALICVDDVRSNEDVKKLLQLDWARWGVRLAFNTSPIIGRQIAIENNQLCVSANDFDHSELREYLKRRGVSWGTIPNDVRQLIRRPIFAKIYADVVDEQSTFRPRNEYDLMEAAWRRLINNVEVGLIRKIAGTIKDDSNAYPWLAETLLDTGFSPEMIERLVNRGFLHDLGNGRIAIWHQRFLCWALAKHLVALFESGVLTLDGLIEATVKCHRVPDSRRIQLGYVPMDVLWLLLDPEVPNKERKFLWKLVSALEASNGFGHDDMSLYSHLLASLGTRVIPLLLDRVRSIEDAERSGIINRVAHALRIIGRDDGERMSVVARECVADGNEALKELGLQLAVFFPKLVDIDRVWEEYRRCIVDDKESRRHFIRRDRASTAFASVAARNLAWVEQQLQVGDASDPCFTSLVFTLSNMPGSAPKKIWEEAKDHLIAAIASENRRCLVSCIVCFGDVDEYGRLEEWASSEHEFVGAVSARGLAYRDPPRAIQLLPNISAKRLWGVAGAIGTALFVSHPLATCSAVESLVRNGDNPEHYFDLVANNGDRLTPTLVEELLDWLNNVLERHLSTDDDSTQPHPRYPLGLIEGLHGETVLAGLRSRQGSKLEGNLVTFATSRIKKISTYVDHEFGHAIELLKRIAGDGFTSLTNELIRAEHQQLRMEGCELAVMRPSAETRRLLADAAVSDELWEPDSSRLNLAQMRAIDSLSALGENAGVVNGILKWGLSVSPDIGALRADLPQMNDDELAPAIALLKSPDNKEFPHAILAIGLSGRQDLRREVENVLLACAYDSELANYCLIALQDLPSNCIRIFDRLVAQYQSGHHKFAVLKALSGCETAKENYLRLLPTEGQLDDMDQRVVEFLAADEATRPLVRSHVEQLLETGGRHMCNTVALLDPELEPDRKLLWETTLQSDNGMHFGGSRARALRSLGKISPDAAFEIGLETLTSDRRDRDTVPQVLLELDPERALANLLRVACESNDKFVCCSVARALRGSGEVSGLRRATDDFLNHDSWSVRRAAAFMAGYFPSGVADTELRRVAFNDPKWGVCAVAQSALRMRQREAEACKLVTTLSSLKLFQVWGTLDCVVRLVDPGVATAKGDPIGLVKAVGALPPIVGEYVSKALKKRTKQHEDDLNSLHGKWKDQD